MSDNQPTPHETLRAAGLRVTAPRVATLLQVAEHHHADFDTIRDGLRERLGTISTQAVYDVLRALTEADLLRRVEPAGAPPRYELQTGDNHHHLVCRRCGAMHDVPCAHGSAPCLDPIEGHGFDVLEAEVIYWGICPQCRRTPTPTGGSPRGRRPRSSTTTS